jgi:hypothetical protein
MQKKYFIILIVLLGGLSTWFAIRHKGSGTADKNKTAFAIDNVSEITKIFISNRQEGNLLLEKKDGIWYVNGKFEASKPAIEFFLNETLKKVRVRGPVPKAARENVIAAMASTATKIEIYLKGDLEKVYYVGQPTSDMTGTYMYLQDNKDPYITHIPGFDGFLSSRFAIQENEWVSKVIYDLKAQDIKSVELLYPAQVNESFTISRKEKEGDFEITASTNAANGKLNYPAIKSYFSLFNSKSCEGFAEFDALKFDTLLKTEPFCVLTLTDTKNRISILRVYKRLAAEKDHGLTDNDGNRLTYDPARYIAVYNNEKRVMVIQDLVFGPILIKYSDFFIKQNSD